MIPAVVSLVLGVAGGAAFVKARSIRREEELKEERDELARRVAQAELAPALPASAGALSIPAQASYRKPDRSANITLPEDAEDFAMLEEAVSKCLGALVEGGEDVSEETLRDCVLQSIYPDFVWPPVPGDPDAARVLWLIVAHESRKELAARSAVVDATLQGESPADQSASLTEQGGNTYNFQASQSATKQFTPSEDGPLTTTLQTNPPRRRSR